MCVCPLEAFRQNRLECADPTETHREGEKGKMEEMRGKYREQVRLGRRKEGKRGKKAERKRGGGR